MPRDQYQPLTIASGAALSNAFENRYTAIGGFITPATLDETTTIGFKVGMDADHCDYPLCDEAGALVAVAVAVDAAKAYPLPVELWGWPYFKLWANASGVDVAQTGAKAFPLFAKG